MSIPNPMKQISAREVKIIYRFLLFVINYFTEGDPIFWVKTFAVQYPIAHPRIAPPIMSKGKCTPTYTCAYEIKAAHKKNKYV
jgi:hypothetical protein